jgi:hypothetical protein
MARSEEFLDRINKMYRMSDNRNKSLSFAHPVNPVHPVQTLEFCSGTKPRNLDRANKMNRMRESETDLHFNHPVNPVHPVQTLKFCSGAKPRNLDRISKINRMYESKTDPHLRPSCRSCASASFIYADVTPRRRPPASPAAASQSSPPL